MRHAFKIGNYDFFQVLLRWWMYLILALSGSIGVLSSKAIAQWPDYSGSGLVFHSNDADDYSVDLEVVGFIFDENKTYTSGAVYTSFPQNNADANNALGYRHCTFQQGTAADITLWGDGNVIACGRYKITVSNQHNPAATTYFTLDLTDGNWLNQSYFSYLVFDITTVNKAGVPTVIVFGSIKRHDQNGIPTSELIPYQAIGNGHVVAYCDFLRLDTYSGFQNVARDRDGFILPAGSYPPIGSTHDVTLDVNVAVTGNIIVPVNNILRVSGDPDPITNGYITTLTFAAGVGIIVQGQLHTDNESAHPVYGVSKWTSAGSGPGTEWAGIVIDIALGYSDHKVYLAPCYIEKASLGVDILRSNPTDVILEGCDIRNCVQGGLRISGRPVVEFCWIENNGNYGIKYFGVDCVCKTTARDKSSISYCHIHNNYGDGIIVQEGRVDIEDTYVGFNTQHGIHTIGGKARIQRCQISSNNDAGIYADLRAPLKPGRTRCWTTVQHTTVENNNWGLAIEGQTFDPNDSPGIRGWFSEDEPVTDEWANANISDPEKMYGYNCITNNNINLYARCTDQQRLEYELAEPFYNYSATSFIDFGGRNKITCLSSQMQYYIEKTLFFVEDNDWGIPNDPTLQNYFQDSFSQEWHTPVRTLPDCAEQLPAGSISKYDDRLNGQRYDSHRPIVDQICSALKDNVLGQALDEMNVTDRQFKNVHLESAYPNPLSLVTNISINLRRAERVRLAVYDILGREVALLLDDYLAVGKRVISYYPNINTAPGLYYCVLTSPSEVSSIKLFLFK